LLKTEARALSSQGQVKILQKEGKNEVEANELFSNKFDVVKDDGKKINREEKEKSRRQGFNLFTNEFSFQVQQINQGITNSKEEESQIEKENLFNLQIPETSTINIGIAGSVIKTRASAEAHLVSLEWNFKDGCNMKTFVCANNYWAEEFRMDLNQKSIQKSNI
jgi:hypothetical protein